MSKENESKVASTGVDSNPSNSEDATRKPKKVMVPFFDGQRDEPNLDSVACKMRPRRSRFNKSDSYHPKNRSTATRANNFQHSQTKEIGANPKPSQNFRGPHNPPRGSDSNFKTSFHGDSSVGRFAYIDKSNVGNIRPLCSFYSKDEVSEPPRDLVATLTSDFRPEFNNPLEGSFEQTTNFVDALIRNSNNLENVVLPDSRSESGNTKSQQLKSVLTKMGILDSSRSPKGLDVKDLEKELDKDMEKHYVFPKYMTSPDPSSIPIPGSL